MDSIQSVISSLPVAHGIRCGVVYMDKPLAIEFDAHQYDHQRPYSPTGGERFQNLLKEGYWLDGAQVRMAWDGEKYCMTDGQHRIKAIIETGIPAIVSLVVPQWDADTDYLRSDIAGKVRPPGVMLHAAGVLVDYSVGKLNSYAAACRLLSSGFEFDGQKLSKLTKTGVVETTKTYVKEIATFESMSERIQKPKGIATGIYRTGILSVVLATLADQREKAIEFWKRVLQDDGLKSGTGEYMLSRFMQSVDNKGLGASQSRPLNAINAATAWNHFFAPDTKRNGCKPVSLPGHDGSWSWPGIHGTRFARAIGKAKAAK